MNLRKIVFGVATVASLSLISAANASHFRGSASVPSVDASGLLTVTTTSFWRNSATNNSSISVAGVGGMAQQSAVIDNSDSRYDVLTSVHTIQLPGAGSYPISWGSCCRISGIQNAGQSGWTMNSQIVWDGQTANTPILFNFNAIQQEISTQVAYSDNLGAAAANGGTLSYNQALNNGINSQIPGFTINTTTGQLDIPLSRTSTFSQGQIWEFSGNIANSDSSFVEFDWLLLVDDNTTNNDPPVVLNDNITATVGDLIQFTYNGTDPNLDPLIWSEFAALNGPGTIANSPFFDPISHTFTWDTTGSDLGNYQHAARAADPDGLTDVGILNITLVAANVSEPAGLAAFGVGLLTLGALRHRKKA